MLGLLDRDPGETAPAADFGLVAMVTSITAFVGLFKEFGFSDATIRSYILLTPRFPLSSGLTSLSVSLRPCS